MSTKYYWTFQIKTSQFGEILGPICSDYVTEENREAWQRFVEKRIREVMKPETMETAVFKKCLEEVREEKEWRRTQDLREEQRRIKHADEIFVLDDIF